MDKFQIDKPKVSVCIPAYNCEKYIASAIKSVLKQTYKDFELLIINNHSTDNTLAIIEGFKDDRIRIIRNKENIGAKNNWNKSLEEAKGEYIKILPADDILADQCIEKQIRIFQDKKNEGVSIVSCLSHIVNKRGSIIMTREKVFQMGGRVSGKAVIKKSIRCGRNIIGEAGSLLFKNKILKAAGFFDDSFPYVIDLDLWFRVLLTGDLFIINEALCSFRVSSTSWSVLIKRKQKNDFWGFIDKIKKDERYNLNFIDVFIGKTMSLVNSILRNIFYKILFFTERKISHTFHFM